MYALIHRLVVYNNSMDLTQKKCVPCEGGTKPLDSSEINTYMLYLKTPWEVDEDKEIEKKFQFKDFRESMQFVNKVAEIAEIGRDHHKPPNLPLQEWVEKLPSVACDRDGKVFGIGQ